ncbi:hypothetical protein ASE12_08535 [Aeromicrobium sp. Root236]|uniref:LppX_LprAFG lipoprotein n=1 Tax=Aeromicrobium sp. Root236 TaxID=1736498 RepID=UPI0006FDE005|nr:LppX_LprAFG lipoprotein [Aeromicrobium sp. Root236]KRC64815.1 hypothetical protein ASE12_08535 [Aeromicrobium sp. Root236]
MKLSRKFSVAAVAFLAALTLSSCGAKDSSGDTSTSGGGGKSGSLTQANFADVLSDSQYKAESGHFEMTMDMGGQSVKAQGDVKGTSPDDMAMTMSMDFQSMTMRMTVLDQTLYMNMGEVSDDKYVKVDLTDRSNPLSKQWGEMMDQMDPANQMKVFKEAVKSFEKTGGSKTIDGVETQRYLVTLDTSKVPTFKDLPDAAKAQVPDTIDYTLFIGSDDLLRRMEFDVAGVESRMDFSKWGEPVDIKAPPADEISDKDFSELADMPAPTA